MFSRTSIGSSVLSTVNKLALLAFSLIGGCASISAAPPIASMMPSEIVANRESLEGKIVVVRGYLSVEPDSVCLIDPDYANDTDPPPSSLFSVIGLEFLRPNFEFYKGKVIVFSARFRSRLARENQFLLNGCGYPGVEIETSQRPLVSN